MIVRGGTNLRALRRPQRLQGLGQAVYYDSYGNPMWDAINRGIDVAGAALSRSPYYSPDDPRYQQGGYYPVSAGGYYSTGAGPGGNFTPATVSTSGFQINWWAAAAIGLFVGAFLLGKRR